MKTLLNLLAAIFLISTFYACTTTSTTETETEAVTDAEPEATPVTLSAAPNSPDYADAMLEFVAPSEGETLPSGDSVAFSYNVTNYELGIVTPDANQKPLANSAQGQHVHLILNNEPYHAIYEPEGFKLALDDGHYVAISFLSRSYHESVKNPEAYKVKQFTVGDGEGEDVDLSAPMLFYSRPKGTYTGNETKSVLFDFYLVNTEIGPGGNQVQVTVNGDTTMMVDQWKPYVLEGLPMGENTVKIELVDSDGNLIDSPINSEERTFTLEGGSGV